MRFAKLAIAGVIREKLIAQGTDPVGTTPEQFGAFMKAESAKWGRVIKEANIRPE